MTVSLGFTYNSLVNNFGFQFLVVPNIVNSIAGGRFAGTPLSPQSSNRSGSRRGNLKRSAPACPRTYNSQEITGS